MPFIIFPIITTLYINGFFHLDITQAAAPQVAVSNIPGPTKTIGTEAVGGTEAHIVILTNPNPNPNYKWQFLTAGLRLFIDRKDGAGWVQLISQIQTAPEYIKRQGQSCVWGAYGLNANTAGGNVLQTFDRQNQANGSTKMVKTYSTAEEGINESLTETWTVPASPEDLGPKGPKVSYSMSKNRGLVNNGNCTIANGNPEGTWRMRWALSGIASIVSDSTDITDGDNWPIRKKSYSNNEFVIDVDDFDNAQNSSSSFSFSEIGTNNKAEIIFFKNGTTGNRVIDPTITTSNISTAWKHNKQRTVLYNGTNFYVFYSKGGTSLFAKAATSTANLATAAEQTILNAGMLSNSEWDIHNFNDASITLAYYLSTSKIQVKTCTLSTTTSTVVCPTASSTIATPITAAATDAITVTRTPSADRIWVGARINADIYVWSASSSVGDAGDVTSWTAEVSDPETNEVNEVSLIPYGNSDKVVFLYQRNAGGTASDGMKSVAVTRLGGSETLVNIDVGASDNAPATMFGNGVRVADNDFRALVQQTNSGGDLIEYKYADNNSAWTSNATVTSTAAAATVGIFNPVLFYNASSSDFYAIYQNNNTATSSIWMQIKYADGTWGAATLIDLSESDANTLPVVNMVEPPASSTRSSPIELVYGYRNANGANFDVVVGNITLIRVHTQSAYRWFENVFDPSSISNPTASGDVLNAIALNTASGTMFMVGYDNTAGVNGTRWHIEARNLFTGFLIYATSSDITTGGDVIKAIALNTASATMYVAGYDALNGNEWRIEARNLSDGSLIYAITSNPTAGSDTANAIALNTASGTMYVAGIDSTSGGEWRIEARNLSDGSLIYATTSDPGVNNDTANAIALNTASGTMYVAGYNNDAGAIGWRIEARNLSDGSLIYATTSNPTGLADTANAIALNTASGTMYVVGEDNGNEKWRIEARNLSDGSLIYSTTSNPTGGNDEANAIALNTASGTMYVAGYSSSSAQWHIQARNLSDGSLIYSTSSNPTTGNDIANSITLNTASGTMYVAGYDSTSGTEWRIEARNLSDGSLLPTALPLAAQNTTTTLTNAGDPFRLQMLIHAATSSLPVSGENFALQFVGKGTGTCASPTGGTPASYTAITTSTAIAFNDNANATDGIIYKIYLQNQNPTHGSDTVNIQTYEEANNFTNSHLVITPGQDGLWDFALKDNSAPANTTYCFRAVLSDNTALDTYTVYPEMTTASVGATISLSGTVYSDEGATTATSAVKLAVNGSTGYTTSTNASGTYTFTSVTEPSATGIPITIWMDNGGGGNGSGALVTRYVSTTLTGLDVYKNRLIVRHDDGGPITNTDIGRCTKSAGSACSDSDLHFATSSGNVTVDNDWMLYLWAGKTFTPGGALTLANGAASSAAGGDLKWASSTAVLSMGTNALSIGGDLINSVNGTLTISGGHTTTFTATSTGYAVNPGSQSFQGLIFNGSGGGWVASSTNMTVSGALTITAGAFTAPTGNLNLAGNFTNNGTFTHNNGTLVLNGANQTISGSTTFYNMSEILTGASTTLTFASGTTQIIANTLTLQGNNAANRLFLRSNQDGAQWNINPQGSKNASVLDIKDGKDTNAAVVYCLDRCVDSGNNQGWIFSIGGGGGSENSGGGSGQTGGSAGGGAPPAGEGSGGGTATSTPGAGQGGGGGSASVFYALIDFIYFIVMKLKTFTVR